MSNWAYCLPLEWKWAHSVSEWVPCVHLVLNCISKGNSQHLISKESQQTVLSQCIFTRRHTRLCNVAEFLHHEPFPPPIASTATNVTP